MVVSLRRAKVKGIARDFTPAQVQLVRVNLDAPRLADVFADAREKYFRSDDPKHGWPQEAGINEYGFFFTSRRPGSAKHLVADMHQHGKVLP